MSRWLALRSRIQSLVFPSRIDRRGVSLVDDFARDLKYAARLQLRTPGFAAVVLVTLAIAIGATVTVFSIVDAWLVKPLNFPEPDRLAVAFAARPERPREPAVWLPYRAYLEWKERSRTLASVSAAFVRDVTVTTATDAQTVLGLTVSPEFFRTFGVGPLIGRTLAEGDVCRKKRGDWHRWRAIVPACRFDQKSARSLRHGENASRPRMQWDVTPMSRPESTADGADVSKM